jgi:hypothetical protein
MMTAVQVPVLSPYVSITLPTPPPFDAPQPAQLMEYIMTGQQITNPMINDDIFIQSLESIGQ